MGKYTSLKKFVAGTMAVLALPLVPMSCTKSDKEVAKPEKGASIEQKLEEGRKKVRNELAGRVGLPEGASIEEIVDALPVLPGRCGEQKKQPVSKTGPKL